MCLFISFPDSILRRFAFKLADSSRHMVVSIAIIAGFFILQVRINLISQETGHQTVLMLLSTAVEFWLIWFWNNLFG